MKNTQRLSLGALLLAVMLVLGYLESLIPLTGMPGVKPGLSNCVLMFSLEWLGGGMSFGLMAGKVLPQRPSLRQSLFHAVRAGRRPLQHGDDAVPSEGSRRQPDRRGHGRRRGP